MAPELYTAGDIPCKAQPTDVFSLGVLFFMMAFGAPPFQSAQHQLDSYFYFLKMKPGNTDFFRFHPHTRQLYRDGLIPECFMKMILSMLVAEPSQRIQKIDSLKDFEFFNSEGNQNQTYEKMEQGAKGLIQHEIMAMC